MNPTFTGANAVGASSLAPLPQATTRRTMAARPAAALLRPIKSSSSWCSETGGERKRAVARLCDRPSPRVAAGAAGSASEVPGHGIEDAEGLDELVDQSAADVVH